MTSPGATIGLTPDEAAFARGLVFFEDEAIMAFNKPPGLSSQGGRGAGLTLDRLLLAFARSNGKRPDLIHRLDRDTSGVILAAKTKPAAGFLGKAMMGRRIKKTYLALVHAPPDPVEGVVEAPLRREEQGRQSSMRVCEPDHPDAESALTRYRTLLRGKGAALVELRPESGRMHQLRVHLAHLGRPILGDPRYGGALAVGGVPVPRLMLHAAVLEFPHPSGGRRRLEAPTPEDFTLLARSAGMKDWSL